MIETMCAIHLTVLLILAPLAAQVAWWDFRLSRFAWKIESRKHEIECLEREIMREQMICATHNPEAARILMDKERMRSLPMSDPDYHHYRRLWAAHLGGEPIALEAITEEEGASCDTAE